MATKTDKKNAIRQGIIDSAVIYSRDLAGKKINDCFLPMTLRVKDSSVEKSTDGDIVDFIFSKEASNGKYCNLIVKDESKNIPDSVRHLIDDSFYTILSE